ncbi:MAG: indoleacetamide hydrolase [Ramlibacter sp.]
MTTTHCRADWLPEDLAELTRQMACQPHGAEAGASRALERAERLQSLCSLIHLDSDAVRTAARQADALPPSAAAARPLHGIALVIKDNIDVAGMPTTGGTPAMAGFIPRRPAPVVERLMEAGAIILGKANLHELSRGVTGENATYGAVRNPADPGRISGGSSAGTAAAIAAGIVPAGIGTDTGGSLRIPAALCGVVGMRPSGGRWPNEGIVPISRTLDTAGPMGRRVMDCALLDAMVTGTPATLEPAILAGLRLGVPRPYFWASLQPEVASVMAAALDRLQAQGVILVECEPEGVAEAESAIMTLTRYESIPALRAYFERHGQAFDPLAFAERIASAQARRALLDQLGAAAVTEHAYRDALYVVRPRLMDHFAACFRNHAVEALVFPTTRLPASPLGQALHELPGSPPVPTFTAFTRNTAPASLASLPAISMPAGVTREGLPVGLELDSPHGSDRRLLAIAMAIETALAANVRADR